MDITGTHGTEVGINLEYWFRQLISIFGNFHLFSLHLASLWNIIAFVGYLLCVVALGFIVYSLVRLYELRHKEEEQLGHMIVAAEASQGPNPRWQHIQGLMSSQNPNDWRQAIIEADILLDDMLTRQGYSGQGVGEKLQKVEAADFSTLQDAWDAHKVRNQIAHAGSSFDLSEVLARRTIAKYEAVFREFGLT